MPLQLHHQCGARASKKNTCPVSSGDRQCCKMQTQNSWRGGSQHHPKHSTLAKGLKARRDGWQGTAHARVQRGTRAVGAAATRSRDATQQQTGFDWLVKLFVPQQPDKPAPEQQNAAQEQQPAQAVADAAPRPQAAQQEQHAPMHQQPPLAQHQQPPVAQHQAPPMQHQPPPEQHQASPVQHQPPMRQHQPPMAQHLPPPEQHLQPPVQQGHHASASGLASGSTGPMKANASDLLAGVPLEQMVQRNKAQQQLKRQLGQLNGSASGDSWGDMDAATQPPAASSSISATAAAPAAVPPPASAAAPAAAAPSSTSSSSSSSSTSTSASSPDEEDDGRQQAGLSAVTSPEAAMALAAYHGAIAHRRKVGVAFRLKHAAEPGQRVKLVGGHKSLGMWSLHDAPELQLCKGNIWQATIKLPAGSITEYKYALLDSSGNVLALQAGNNGVLAIRMNDQRLEVQDTWAGDSSGGQVVSEGEVGLAWPVNRETRLQAWAADMFQQLAMMRQDLRLARMEVVGAQEETREARMEALRYQSQLLAKQVKLAEVETEHALDKARLVEAETINSMLKEQLAETTASLQEAIELLASEEEEQD
ncbi:hypothetical protein CHLNCDRAFT_53918 [Chlorella variabilis]|uniref:CBM20 domain-containing protein n=1 Tax=Chlorella variabilis TaxID=554065 RepID=E1ZL89_CHLVA|nr:hypothetical protein CHLNCDRAFT_53918 [Chlorella variabilis]EFN53360.1 hypothetical protein CHLNCDRAFT_53918 [Chlorella variabilis]|eukprot:XP_005845462.1 hypothetical protein CHLNCDRAFT_53918 [Chlorella variabilis]